MTEIISLKHNSAAFFKEKLKSFKKNTQDNLRLLKTDVNSISLDSTKAYDLRKGENTLQTAIPHNFYDDTALRESSRGASYAVLPELKGKPVTIFDIMQGLTQRGVTDRFLQERAINLILQCRGAVHFGLAQPMQELAAENNMIVSPITDSLDLKFEVQNADQIKIKIEMPIQTPNMDMIKGCEEVGIIHCELNITKSSIYLNAMTYTKTSDTPNAEKLLQIVSKDYSFLSEIWSKIKEFIGIVEQKPEFELSCSSPVI